MRRIAPMAAALVFCGLLSCAECAHAQAPADAGAPATEAAASAPPTFDKGDNAWMLTSAALVLFMTAPGLALFYGGLVRKKNVLGVMMQCIYLMGLLTVVWAIYGYSLSFGGDPKGEGYNPYIGNADYV